MRVKTFVFVSFLLIFNITAVFGENVAPQLHIDPFINPLQTVHDSQETSVDKQPKGSIQVEEEAPRKSFLFQPDLRGVILSDDTALANIGGEMIKLGQKYEGFRLIKVKGQSVVFEKNGKHYPVSLDGTDEEGDTL